MREVKSIDHVPERCPVVSTSGPRIDVPTGVPEAFPGLPSCFEWFVGTLLDRI